MKKRTFTSRLPMCINAIAQAKKRIISIAFVLGYLLAVSLTSSAQNPTGHYHNIYNQALDYMGNGNYMLLGRSDPAMISTYDNSAAFGNNARIHLQILDPTFLTTLNDKTYCTQDEITMILNSHCNSLSVSFYPRDAKQTSDGGFIICGNVRRDMETNSCGLPAFNSEFLLKVNSSGGVQWFKRYEDQNGERIEFTSVIETNTGNYIATGTYTQNGMGARALMVATDNTGGVINQHIMNMNLYSDPTMTTPTDYREVTAFSAMGNVYYAMVGSSYSYMPVEGGVLISVVDGSGTLLVNTVVTSAGHDIALIARGVTGTGGGTIAITGESLPYNANLIGSGGPYTYNFMPFVLKLDPFFGFMFGTVDFLKSYQSPYDDVLPYSITSAGEAGIFFSGDYRGIGAFMYQIDNTGNWVKGDAEGVQTGYYSSAIVYDWNNSYAVYSGDAKLSTYPSFVTTDEYNNNLCGVMLSVLPRDIPFNYYQSSPGSVSIYDINDVAADFDVQTVENIACGIAMKPGRPSGIEQRNAAGELKIAPNPANGYIDISLPSTLMHGKIDVVDMLGRTVLTKQLAGGDYEQRIDISTLNNGVYILSVKEGNTKQQVQFVKY